MIIRITLAAFLLSILTGPVHADPNSRIKGTYNVASHVTCTQDAPANIMDHFSGSITFDGNGNAIESVRVISIFTALDVGPGLSELTCVHRYSVDKERSLLLNGSCTGVVTEGGGKGLRIELSPVLQTGQLSESGAVYTTSMVTSTEDPQLQQFLRVTDPDGNVLLETLRVCGGITVGIRMLPQ